jgi:hypothetical protein
MNSNRLQLNADKTELLWCTTVRHQGQLPSGPLSLGGFDVQPSTSVRNLGIYVDADLTLRRHVDVVVSRCFGALRQLRSIRQYVPSSVLQTLVTSLVLTRMDYGNAVLVGLPACQLRRLQSVQNAAARFIFGLQRHDHVTDALISLHWLRVPERIRFKVAVLVYRALRGTAPMYLTNFLSVANSGRRGLRSADTERLVVPRTRLSTIAGAVIWNSLPTYITSSPSLAVFRSRLKTYLFGFSFPDLIV